MGIGSLALGGCGLETSEAAEGSTDALTTDFTQLRQQLAGKLRLPGDSGYDTARLTFNPLFDARRPGAVASIANADDVKACITFARGHALKVAARSGGHSYGGYSQPDKALVVDLRAMNSVDVAADGTTVVGAGARLIDVYEAVAAAGRCIPAGSCPSVGVSGLTLGGGIGVLARLHGLTCDALVGADVVLADGSLKTVNEENDADLFWALRGGGGGNFGIVTSFTFAAPEAPRTVVVFSLQFPAGSATDVLGAWQSWIATLPNEAWSNCVVPAGSTPSIRVGGSFVGTKTAIDSLIDDFVAQAHVQPTKCSVVEKTYIDAMRYFGGCSTKTLAQCHVKTEGAGGILERQGFVASSRMLEAPMSDPSAVTTLLKRYSGMDVLFDSLGGKVAEIAPDATAFPHRNALASVQIYKGASADSKATVTRQVGEVQAALADIVGGGTYINYIDPNQIDWRRASYKENLGKLESVSKAYDPDGFFAFAQSISTA